MDQKLSLYFRVAKQHEVGAMAAELLIAEKDVVDIQLARSASDDFYIAARMSEEMAGRLITPVSKTEALPDDAQDITKISMNGFLNFDSSGNPDFLLKQAEIRPVCVSSPSCRSFDYREEFTNYHERTTLFHAEHM